MGKENIRKEQIADYVWLGKTQRSWHILVGNPFCVSLYCIPLKKMTKDEVIKTMRKANMKEKARFKKMFPDVEWREFNSKERKSQTRKKENKKEVK